MALSWNNIEQQVANLLGNVKGAIVADAETNYTATMSNTTLKGPDFVETAIQDAITSTFSDIVEAIAETPFHPHRTRYADTILSVSSGGVLSATATGGARVIGVPGRIIDSSDSAPLRPAKSLDDVISFNRFKAAGSVYPGKNEYLFAFDDKTIYHTRTTVTITVVVFDRPSTFTGNIGIDDTHETALVMGSVARLAPKEAMYMSLATAARAIFDAHIAAIRAYGLPAAWGTAQAAPSVT